MVDIGQVGGIDGAGGVQPTQPSAPGKPQTGGPDFKDLLSDSIREIEQLQAQADQAIDGLVTGAVTNVSQAMLAIERADMAFRTMMEIRNKILAAYEEINRIPL